MKNYNYLSCIKDEGYEACILDYSADENPYEIDTDEFWAWFAGWCEASEDY